ncbi:hypothetical protein ABFS83_07G032500 [Erythranthe nasuta]
MERKSWLPNSLPYYINFPPSFFLKNLERENILREREREYLEREREMENEVVKCECCGLKEECTEEYINEVKSKFEGKWLCGLCSEAVRDEIIKRARKVATTTTTTLLLVDEAVKAHMSFCRKYKSNPATRVADGMVQMLRRRSAADSSSSPSPSSKKYSRSASTSQVGDNSRFSY